MDEFRLVREFGLGLYDIPAAKVQTWKRILIAEADKSGNTGSTGASKEGMFLQYARRVHKTRTSAPRDR